MNAVLRRLDTGQRSARSNVAWSAALVALHRAGEIPDTIRFHRYPHAVLLGRHQNLCDAVDAERCRSEGVEIARRVSGGGAVYMTPAAITWDLVVSRKALQRHRADAAAALCDAVAAALSQLGVPARRRGDNEIIVSGRKLCGTSGYFDGDTLLQQGTILVDADLARVAALLRLRGAGEADTAEILRAHLVTLSELLGRTPRSGEVEPLVAAGIADLLGASVQEQAATAREAALAEALERETYGRDAYVLAGVEDGDAALRRAS